MRITTRRSRLTAFATAIGCLLGGGALAEPPSLNYDNLAFFEEPLAWALGPATLTYNQLIDIPAAFNFTRDDSDFTPRTRFELGLETQLPNALTVGAVYAGSFNIEESDDYADDYALFAGGVWGTVLIGEVTGTVRESTRRARGAGNAELAFDDVLGRLREKGVAYSGRYSAFTATGAVDLRGSIDLGIAYERPSRTIDHRFTLRYTNGEFRSNDGLDKIDTHAVNGVAEVIYGAFLFDLGFGYERLDGRLVNADRFTLSSGFNYKINRFTISGEGHVGTIDGEGEYSFSAGSRYDIARGLSVNLGYNYRSPADAVDGVNLQPGKASELILSSRYEF